MKKLVLAIVGLILILAAAGLVLWLVNVNVPSSNLLKISAVLGQDQRMISQIGPEVRTRLQDGYQEILDSPVYFDLRAPSWFKGAWVEIVYQADRRKLVSLGGLVLEPWDYDLKQPIAVVDLDGGWQKATFYFNLKTLLNKKNIKRFLIDSSGQPGEVLKIRSINVILER